MTTQQAHAKLNLAAKNLETARTLGTDPASPDYKIALRCMRRHDKLVDQVAAATAQGLE